MQSTNSYVLSVGEKGKERLGILNELFEETSHKLLLKAGLKKGQTVLEIGCGTGLMTCWMAEQVGSSGHVYSVDISVEQLEIARQHAQEKNLSNITFIHSSVYELKDLPMFDLIYSRFIIMHLTDPFEALQIMSRFLKKKGVMVCEEASNQTTCCYPVSEVFQNYRNLLMKLGKLKGLDYNLGEKIYSHFLTLKFKNIYTNFVQPIYQNKRDKLIIPLLVTEIKENVIKNQIATESELDSLLSELYKFIEDDSYFVSFARTTQIVGQLI